MATTNTERFQNVFGRLEAVWRPASAEEGFEIVRQRLFEPIIDPKDFTARDAAARAYAELYRSQSGEFPSTCREAVYERRIKAAYLIHPELTEAFYAKWTQLEGFQRTRGVLRTFALALGHPARSSYTSRRSAPAFRDQTQR